jgi:hypothetical protein
MMSPDREFTRPVSNGPSDLKRLAPDSLHGKLLLEARVGRLAEKVDELAKRVDTLSKRLTEKLAEDQS